MTQQHFQDALLGFILMMEMWHVHLHMSIAIKIARLEARYGLTTQKEEDT
jgi:hypothetical protein